MKMLLRFILVSLVLGLTVNASTGTCGSYVVDSAGQDLSFSSYLYNNYRNLAGGKTSTVPSSVSQNVKAGTGSSYVDAKKKKRATGTLGSFLTAKMQTLWTVSDWDRTASPVKMQNNAGNVFVDFDPTTTNGQDTMLSFVTNRGQNGVQQAGEVTSKFKLNYGSIRFEARVTGDSGACAGMFLYANDTLESDFEFLTQEGFDNIHLTNQPGNIKGIPVPGATSNVTLQDSSNNWNTYRLDWTPGMTRYFINGNIVVNKTINVSEFPMYWMMNIWSDGTSWPGVMKIGDSARLDVRWLVIAYNKEGETFGDVVNDGFQCQLQNEMNGQGLVVNENNKRDILGGSIVARAKALVKTVTERPS